MTRLALDSEDALEQATLALFRQMDWDTVNCFDEVFGDVGDVALQRLDTPRRPNLGWEDERGSAVPRVARDTGDVEKITVDAEESSI